MNVITNNKSPNISPFITLLIGPQHVGKSTVGKQLATLQHIPFYDTDEGMLKNYIHESHAHNEYNSCPAPNTIGELYTQVGEQEFRTMEYKEITRIFSLSHACVCASGGGMADNTLVWDFISTLTTNSHNDARCVIVLLQANPKVVWQYIIPHRIPAYISTKPIESMSDEEIHNHYTTFSTIFTRRMKEYEKYASIIINTEGKTPNIIAEEINNTLV